MKSFGRRKVRKHKEIRGSDKIVNLDISAKFDSLNKTETTSSESKERFGKIRKGVGKRSGFQYQSKVAKIKKAMYAIVSFSEKDIPNIIKKFEKIEKLPYEKKRLKNEPTESYFCLAKQIAKCMIRSDKLNWYDHGSYTKMTDPSSNVNVTNESESKRSIVNENLLHSGSTKDNKSKRSIVNKPLSQKGSAKENELRSTEEDESECSNMKQKEKRIRLHVM